MEKLVEFLDSECINEKSKEKEFTALHLAVRGDNENDRLVLALLRHPKVELDVKDSDDWTPLHHACYRGFCNIVIALQNANFCCLNHEGDSPLHIAAANQHTAIFTALSQCQTFKETYAGNRVFLEAKDSEGNTLLHLAVDAADGLLVEWCFEFGFSVRLCNATRMNCMHTAARRGDYDVAVQVLKQAKKEGGEVLRSFIDLPNSVRATPLYMCAKFGNAKVMELLLENGASKDSKTNMQFTPLLAAIRYAQPQTVQLLLKKGANVLAKDRLRHYNAILWAVEIQNPDILKMLLLYVADNKDLLRSIWKATDQDKNTPHHIAAKARNLDLLKTLMRYNTSCLEERNREGFTPFHIAVREGKLPIMNFIMSSGVNAVYILDGHGSSGLHLAAEYGHSNIVDRLLRVRSSDNAISTRDNRGWTPIHLAAKNGHLETLELLLRHSPLKETCEIIDDDHHTALYLACAEGWPKCVDFLIKWGAMVTYNYNHHEEEKAICCLNAAIDGKHTQVVTTILESEQWHQALQFCSYEDRKNPETPLRKLIKKMPSAAKVAFERCVQIEQIADERGSYYKEVHYNYDYVEDFQDIFSDEGPKVSDCDDEGKQTQQKKHQRREQSYVLKRMDTPPIVPRGAHKGAQTMKREESRGEMMVHFQHHEPTATPREPHRAWGPKRYHYHNHPLHLMVLYKRQELLKHPLVASFIHHKWNIFGRWVYYPNVALYTLLMLLLTAYIYLRFDYSKLLIDTYEKQVNTSLSLSDCSQNITLDSLTGADDDVVRELRQDKTRLITCSVIIILNCIARIIIEVLQIIHHRRDYFLHFINYMEGVLYIATIIFVSNFQLQCLPSWQWQLGALCIFLSWINFILFLSEQPVVGIYVVMFQDIIKTFVKIAPMAILLVLAFGQPFFMLLSVVETTTPPQQFVTFPYSLLKTLSMTTGELETDPIFFSTPSVVTYPVITYLLWIVFLIIMPILLQNLLVGLAVDDIKGVQEKAALKKEALQIGFTLDVLSRLPKVIVRWRNKRSYTQTWGKGPFEKFWKWLNGSYWKPELKLNSSKEYSVAQKVDKMVEVVYSMEKRMQQLNEQCTKLEKMMIHISQEQERNFEPRRSDNLRRMKGVFHSSSEPNLSEL
ncbi:Transient receptor potential cation channel subfamily A member 1 homolog [Geodia barretti]|nr:Transient receptor potential cation channel subfamily A member 1 homolog [Geodia barretti]